MSSTQQILSAANFLCSGEVVAFPTETVYGLGAEISQPSAIQKVFKVKGRPTNHPLITHIVTIADFEYWAKEIPESAWRLAEEFWPGPLTLILPKSEHVPLSVTGGQDTVGLRIPRHPIAQALLKALGRHKAIVAPSANRFGHISPTSSQHVEDDFGNKIKMILDGGSCEIGLESTIVSCIGDTVTMLRPGGISIELIEDLLNQKILSRTQNNSLRAPGTLSAHYAPTTPLEIWPSGNQLLSRAKRLHQQGMRTAILARTITSALSYAEYGSDNIGSYYVTMPTDPAIYGQKLYATMRALDQKGFDRLLVEELPGGLEWLAITDRLRRASFASLPLSHNTI